MNARKEFDKDYNIRTDGQISATPINLDGMYDCDLKVAAAHPALHADVRLYASLKLAARTSRLGGCIASAMHIEQRLDRMYDTVIPLHLKW